LQLQSADLQVTKHILITKREQHIYQGGDPFLRLSPGGNRPHFTSEFLMYLLQQILHAYFIFLKTHVILYDVFEGQHSPQRHQGAKEHKEEY